MLWIILMMGLGQVDKPAPAVEKPPYRMERILNLSDEQMQKWRELQIELEKEMTDIRYSIAKKNIELKEAVNSNASISKVEKILKDIEKLRYSMALKKIEYQMKFYNVLNEEQKEKYLHFLIHRKIHRRHHRKPHLR